MKIEIGIDRQGNNAFFHTRFGRGITVVEGTTGVGKSQNVKNIYIPIANTGRNTLIIDYAGEHRLSKYSNLLVKGGMGIPWLYSVSNITLKISDMDKPEDWLTLNFPPEASKQLAELSKLKQIHKNKFETFEKMLRDFPNHLDGIWIYEKFQEKWGHLPKSPIHKASKDSIISKLPLYEYIFWEEGDTWVENYALLLKQKKCLHVNLDLEKEDRQGIIRARVVVGKILQHITEYGIRKIKPLIVIEEADRVFPSNLPVTEPIPSSVLQLEKYVTKAQKFGVELICVTQSILMLHESISKKNNWIYVISGPGGNFAQNYGFNLKWDIDKGTREFALFKKGSKFAPIFTPKIVPCKIIEY